MNEGFVLFILVLAYSVWLIYSLSRISNLKKEDDEVLFKNRKILEDNEEVLKKNRSTESRTSKRNKGEPKHIVGNSQIKQLLQERFFGRPQVACKVNCQA